jgi:outer membrane protein TolC
MNKIGKRIIAMLLLPGFTAALAQQQAQQLSQEPVIHAFSIRQCLDYSHKHNWQVKNAMIDVLLQQQTNKGITAGALPTLSATGSTTDYLSIPVQAIPNPFSPAVYGILIQNGVKGNNGAITLPQGGFGTIAFSLYQQYYTSGGINLSQTLFDGQVFVGLQARKTSIDYYQKAIDVTQESISVNIYKVYYQLVVSRTQMDQIDANIARAQKLLNDTRALYENGFQEKLDVDKATVQLANLETQKHGVQVTIDNGYLGLKYLIGIPVKDSLVLTDNFSEENIKNGVLDDSLHRYEDRNDFQALLLSEKLNEYNIKRYKYSYLPTASLNAAYQKNAFSQTYDMFSQAGTWYTTAYVGLSVNVPIFNGFVKNANLQTARLQLMKTQNQLDDMKNSIDNDIAQARNRFKSDILTVDFQRRNMALAESVYDQTRKKYESGLASNTDVTNAQTDLITAQTNFINALYDAVIAKVDYQKAIGKLKY